MNSVLLVIALLSLLRGAAALTQAQSINRTRFADTYVCDRGSNSYLYSVSNGYRFDLQATITLDCEGDVPTSDTFTVPEFTNLTTRRSISPPNVSVRNRLCRLFYYGVDPLDSETKLYQSISDTCGAAVVDDDDDATCGYAAFWCMFDTGDWYRNAFSYFIIQVCIFAVQLIVVIGFIISFDMDNSQKIADGARYSQHVKENRLSSVYETLPSPNSIGIPENGTDEAIANFISATGSASLNKAKELPEDDVPHYVPAGNAMTVCIKNDPDTLQHGNFGQLHRRNVGHSSKSTPDGFAVGGIMYSSIDSGTARDEVEYGEDGVVEQPQFGAAGRHVP